MSILSGNEFFNRNQYEARTGRWNLEQYFLNLTKSKLTM